MHLSTTIPALPVTDIAAAVDFYADRFSFAALHQDEGFAVLRRDDAIVHLWGASDTELAPAEVLHPVDRGAPVDTDWGTREFATLDVAGNLLTFFQRT